MDESIYYAVVKFTAIPAPKEIKVRGRYRMETREEFMCRLSREVSGMMNNSHYRADDVTIFPALSADGTPDSRAAVADELIDSVI